MVQFEWHDGTVKNVHVDPPFLYEYHVSNGSNRSEYVVWEERMWGRHHGMWRPKTIDWTPSYKQKLFSASRHRWSFLHLFPREEPVKQKSLIFWGQDLLPLPSEAMKYLNFLVLWQTHQWFSGMFILPGYPWPWHLIPRSQPSPHRPFNQPSFDLSLTLWPVGLQKQLSRAMRMYERRIEWLSLASRRIWGTVCEKRYLPSK